MDIAEIEPHNIEIKIKHPATGKYVGIKFECQSTESDAVKAVRREATNRNLKLSVRNKTVDADEMEATAINFLAAAIVGFTFELDDDGKPGSFKGETLTYNTVNVKKLLGVGFIRGQVDEGLAETARFFTI